MMDAYTQKNFDQLKQIMGASDVHYDLLGITLTINGQPLFIPNDALLAMRALANAAEMEEIDRRRQELAAERGP